ncbi:DUF6153 family protein [Streptomyces sp. GQFP]|uniref:DUF6153 family protein n=1 Tax=Streptomyces sp. GQFP TaxID=2907545 RepID=UPI001F478524|nr:DUF6153 family protein [Streptomyces sp. GQFP]UIX32296.1 DUF6153 family protein [Streptomyces sp. GQFP]
MSIRSARSGGAAARWAYGVFLTLCVALAVLVHHETSAMGLPSVPSAAHAAMPGMAHAAHVMPDETAPAVSDDSSHGADDNGACAAPGMQHCAAASIDSVQLAVPAQAAFDPLANPGQAVAGRTPGATVGRAPPDLSVLSQLRI